MPRLISEVLGTTHEELIATGAFDGFVEVDSQVHVDPHLLAASSASELATSRGTFEQYFRDLLKILEASTSEGDVFWVEAIRRLTIPEIPNTGLGYTKEDTSGSAIGPELALRLARLEAISQMP